MKQQLNKDTNKFWSFKDTKSHRNIKINEQNKKTIRIFKLKKSFLLKVSLEKHDCENEIIYVIPSRYVSCIWPEGFYTAYYKNRIISFVDENIIKVVQD